MNNEMGELTQTEVYPRLTQQAWEALLTWLGFCLQIFSQIVGAFVHYPLLSLSSSDSSFNPLSTLDHDSPPQTSAVVITSDQRPLQKLTDAEGEAKIKYVTVFFKRPGLKEFLKQLSEFADLVLFTAGLEGYARPLVDRIDTENRFSLRLYQPSTVSTVYREHVKDLTCISKDLSRIVIVDNNPFSFLLQPHNGIPCVSFSARQPHDPQLLDVILPLLKHLSDQKDVRHVLSEQFHMPEWFQLQGVSAPQLTAQGSPVI